MLPHSPRAAHEHHVGLGAAREHFRGRAGSADLLSSVVNHVAGRVDQEALAAFQSGHNGVDHGQRAIPRRDAVLAQVRHLERLDQTHQGQQERVAVHASGDHGAHRLSQADMAPDQRRVDVTGMVRQHECRPAQPLQFFQPDNLHSVAPMQSPPRHPPKNRLQ